MSTGGHEDPAGAMQSQPTSLCNLPSELIASVLEYLPSTIYPSLCLTHSIFNNVLRDDFLWRQVILRNLNRSVFSHSWISCTTAVTATETSDPIDATSSCILTSPAPYRSYHELYIKVFRKYGWMLGTFAGDAQWMGSMVEIFYNPGSGAVEGRKVQAYALFTTPRYYSIDSDVIWRDFDPVLQAWREPLFQLGNDFSDDRNLAFVSRPLHVSNDKEFHVLNSEYVWPPLGVPVTDRILYDDAPELPESDELCQSDDVLALSRPILSRAMFELPTTQNPPIGRIPRHTELFYRLPMSTNIPSGFEDHSGLFVGDYSSHGPELIYLYYPTPTSLHAVKITGDPNVPRGELTWVVDDIRSQVRVCREREWANGRAYLGRGQISAHGFRNPTWIDTEVILYHARTDKIPHTIQSSMSTEQMQAYIDLHFSRGDDEASTRNARAEPFNHGDHDSVQDRFKFPGSPEQAAAQSIDHQRKSSNHTTKSSDSPWRDMSLKVERAGVVLWWKDMAHLSQFHKVTGISDHHSNFDRART